MRFNADAPSRSLDLQEILSKSVDVLTSWIPKPLRGPLAVLTLTALLSSTPSFVAQDSSSKIFSLETGAKNTLILESGFKPASVNNFTDPREAVIPLDERGTETVVLQIAGDSLDWKNYLTGLPFSEEFPKRVFDNGAQLIADGLGTTTQEMSDKGNLITVSPSGEDDQEYTAGVHHEYNKDDPQAVREKLAEIRDQILKRPEVGRVIIQVMTHGGASTDNIDRVWLGTEGIPNDEFNAFLASINGPEVIVIMERCYGGKQLLVYENHVQGSPNTDQNSLESATFKDNPNITVITTSANDQVAATGFITGRESADFTRAIASEILLSEIVNRGSLIEALNITSQNLVNLENPHVYYTFTFGQRLTMRTVVNGVVYRVSIPSEPSYTEDSLKSILVSEEKVSTTSTTIKLNRAEDGTIQLRNYSTEANKITLSNGQIVELKPGQILEINDPNITYAEDKNGFKTTLVTPSKDAECIVVEPSYTRVEQRGSITNLSVPVGNRCEVPVEITITTGSTVGVFGSTDINTIPLETKEFTLLPLEYLVVPLSLEETASSVNGGRFGVPLEVGVKDVLVSAISLKGPFSNQNMPLPFLAGKRVYLPIIIRE